jgi:hypothetical protein
METTKLKTAAVFTDEQLWRFAQVVAAETANEDATRAAINQACSAAAIVTGQDPTGAITFHTGWKPGVDYILKTCERHLPADAVNLFSIYHQLKQAALEHAHDCVVN